MSDSVAEVTATPPAAETGVLARELASAFGRLAQQYREQYGLSPEEARQRTSGPNGPEHVERLLNMPADQVSWHDLDAVARTDPERALRAWEAVKAAALEELRSGHCAAKIMEPASSRCWHRARFLASRHDLAEEWLPRSGIERQLIDTMARAQTSYLFWLEALTARSTMPSVSDRLRREEEGCWAAPRQSDADAIEQAAAMVDRFNRIFLRTLRALRDLRRYSPQVIVQHAGQVNIGETQVNVAG